MPYYHFRFADSVPLTVTSTTTGQRLCHICCELRLDRFLSAPESVSSRYSQYTQARFLSWENSIQWSRTCPLCQLFRSASGNRDGDVRTPYVLRLVARSLLNAHDWAMPELDQLILKGPGRPSDSEREALRDKEAGAIYFAVTEDHEQDRCSTADLTADVRRFGMISWCHVRDNWRNQGRGRVIDHREADTRLISTWLDYCDRNHTQCRTRSLMETVDRFQLIDCTTEYIVRPPPRARYMALSYVWGRSSPSDYQVTGGKLLVDRLPKTVLDAILATRQLGFRYLWVDRYCIPDDPKIKHAQISRMNVIYQNAFATLIAAGGEDASHGLPGIGSRSRTPQISVQLGNIKLFTTLPHPDTIIRKSVWMTRGWTYQEAILSRRRIFFTDQQVYFECNSMQCLEALPPTLDEWHTADRSSFLSSVDRPIFTVPTASVGLSALRLFTSTYTRRKLSFDSDSLNGFLGVLAYFETLNIGFRHWWGIPFTTEFDYDSRPYSEDYIRLLIPRAPHGDPFHEAKYLGYERPGAAPERESTRPREDKVWLPDHCFMNTLLWTHKTSDNKRRSHFPSWSWFGWEGSISPVTLGSGYHGCNCDTRLSYPAILTALTDDDKCVEWDDLKLRLTSQYTPLTSQFRSIGMDTRVAELDIFEYNTEQEQRLMSNGFYITTQRGRVTLPDGVLDDCKLFAKLHLDNESDVRADIRDPTKKYVGLKMGCGGNDGLLIVRPTGKETYERVGVVDIKGGSEYHGVLSEVKLMDNNSEWSSLVRHWYDGDGYHSRNCSVFDIGGHIAVNTMKTTFRNWDFKWMPPPRAVFLS